MRLNYNVHQVNNDFTVCGGKDYRTEGGRNVVLADVGTTGGGGGETEIGGERPLGLPASIHVFHPW